MGKLIVLEGIDGSGKSTQFKLICERLKKENIEFKTLAFPQYDEPSSALIKMYLGGEFGSDPKTINPYAASTFYSVDRYASYVKKWQEYYLTGGIIVSDRYTTSNAIHQASKLEGNERKEYFEWLYDFEFNLMGLPSPDKVIYMNISVEAAEKQMRLREKETNTKADIHELDTEYLKKCAICGSDAADYYGWEKIDCIKDGEMRSIDSISDEVFKSVLSVI